MANISNVLVVIDMQNDFIDGVLGSAEACEIVDRVKQKVDLYKSLRKPVYFTQDTHFEDYLNTFEGRNLPIPHCIYKQHGWEISEKLIPNTSEMYKVNPDTLGFEKVHGTKEHIIFKDTFGYENWKFPEFIKAAKIEHEKITKIYSNDTVCSTKYKNGSIEVVGLCTDICVISNVLILRADFPDTEIVVDASCCAGTSKEAHEAALKVMESCQIKILNKSYSLDNYKE